ncbi:MAG: GGDEF domain-containing protein [Candidatus Krumholzibacteriota bacterium]|nr:GGDEF domain-containing protein [Candidatus Krumholzibacteriota bacterium]
MHRELKKDYHDFLLNLIPRHLLSDERIESIIDALSLNDRKNLVREAYLSMEELREKGVFIKKGVRESGNRINIEYEEVGNQKRFTLEMNKSELKAVSPLKSEEEQKELIPGVFAKIISALSLNSSMTIVGKINKILSLAPRVKANSRAFLLLNNKLNIVGTHSSKNIFEKDIDDILKNQLYGKVLKRKRLLIILDSLGMKNSFFELNNNVKKLVLFPLISAGKKIGVLEIHCFNGDDIGKATLLNLFIVGQGIIRLLKNSIQLEQMVSVDKLTGVNNRNYYETQVPLELERASRDKKFLAFLIMDIDHFKVFNDKYGHDTGDEVLRLIARTIKSHLRKIDLFIRFGGEEFVAVLPGANREAAMRTAERLRNVIEKTKFTMEDGKELNITISIGGSIFPVDAKNQTELFKNADKSLLKAKRNGRNRVIFF